MNDENKCSGLNCPMQIGFKGEDCEKGNGCPFFTAKKTNDMYNSGFCAGFCTAAKIILGTIENDAKEEEDTKVAEAIAKQIPTVVTPEQRYYGIGRCPRCDVVFTDSSTKYCGNCGQRVLFNENVSRET